MSTWHPGTKLADGRSAQEMLRQARVEAMQENTAGMVRKPSSVAMITSTAFETIRQRTESSSALAAEIAKAKAKEPLSPSKVQLAEKPAKGKKKGPKSAQDRAKGFVMDEHLVPLSDVVARYQTRVDEEDPRKSPGLSNEEVIRAREITGPNRLSPPKDIPLIVKYLLHFVNFFMLLLEAAGVLSFIAYGVDSTEKINLYIGCILFGIVFLTCTISFIQEHNSNALMASFSKMLPSYCIVRRNGEEARILAEELVLGDIVLLTSGNRVPADLRVLQSNGLKVDNSSLTGENDPQPRKTETTEKNPLEAHNIAWYSTLVLGGDGVGLVVRVGDSTLIGEIAALTADTNTKLSTLQIEIRNFVHKIAILAISMGLVFLAVGFGLGFPWTFNILNMIGVIIANVPEGLPATVTACLTITAKRLAEKHVFVKKLEIVETLGSITTIATDKTGTLTENRMSAVHMWYDRENHSCRQTEGSTEVFFDPANASCEALLTCAALCNRAVFDAASLSEPDISKRDTIGDASESALLRLTESLFSVSQFREENQKLFEIPFNSKDKFQLSVHRRTKEMEQLKPVLLMKGAPEVIIKKCSHALVKGQIIPKDEQFEKEFIAAYEGLGKLGERVLGFAQVEVSEQFAAGPFEPETVTKFSSKNLVFIGLISLVDPPRMAVPGAIADCHTAGIRVIMVTGDHPFTAKAIGRKIGLITYDTVEDVAEKNNIPVESVDDSQIKAVVVHGNNLLAYKQADWDRTLSKPEVIFARTSPQQKLQIVEQLQNKGHIVAVTGDGVNDSPALKQANVGCAMGIVGSEVAKEAADIILMDDNFASIVAGVREGRAIFDNLRKSIAYTLSHLLPEIIPFLCNIAFGFPLGLSSLLILFIDLGTELAPAVSLAYEEPEADIMQRKPRCAAVDRMVSKQVFISSYLFVGIIETFCGFANFFYVFVGVYGMSASALPFTAADYFKSDAPLLNIDGRGFTADEQMAAVTAAQSAWFASIVVCQIFNLLSSKTRRQSAIPRLFSNKYINIGICIELAICCFLIYVPPVHEGIANNSIPGECWAIALPFGVLILAQSELKKYFVRKYPGGFVDRYLQW
eukprot:GILK01002761.1.p1 GENE.GILK01002761.1~~GILK01002761.1.p1  ORF type:complete len:1120 (-),score=227.27 GILK01002761.1:234-3500(-)